MVIRDVGGRRGGRRWALGLLMATAVVGCTRPRTQLVVGVDTDLAWGPGEVLRSIQVTVRSNDPEGQLRDRRVVELGAANPLPASFGVVPLEDDPSRRVWIEVRGCGARGCDDPLVTQRAYVGFVEGQTLLLRMTLAGACQGVTCTDPTEVCLPTTGVCGSARVEASTLPGWTGVVPRATGDVPEVIEAGSDAGIDAAGADALDSGTDAPTTPDAEALDLGSSDVVEVADVPPGRDVETLDDGGPTDVEVARDVTIDLGTDVGCAATCGGTCVDLQRDPQHCGTCGRACSTVRANSVAGCAAGACEVRCGEGFGDCDANVANGCEVRLAASAAHCGRCGGACPARANASAVCVEGGCGFTCNAGFADCDGDGANGCEVATATSVMHCGACGNVCRVANGTAACVAGACGVGACAAGYGNCDGSAANGCERGLLTDATNCGGCGVACRPANATGACAAGVCGVGACATGYGNCDGSAANGCETDVRVSIAHCGRCGGACAAGDYCVTAACRAAAPATTFLTTRRTNTISIAGVATDAVGNVYISGTSSGAIDFGPDSVSGAFIASLDPAGSFRWARALPMTPTRFSVDGAGNLTLILGYASNPNFGSGAVVGEGYFLSSYSAAGVVRWARFVGTSALHDIASASAGEIVVVGGTGDFDFGTGSAAGPLMVGLSSDGRPRWTRLLVSLSNPILALGISARAEPCIAAYVSTSGVVEVGGEPLPRAGSATNLLIGCYGSDGSHQWSRRVGDVLSPSTTAPTIARASNGRVVVAMSIQQSTGLPNNVGCGSVASAMDTILVSYGPSGGCLWNAAFDTGYRGPAHCAIDENSNAYLSGGLDSSLSLGSGTLPGSSWFVASYNSLGAGRWSRAFTATGCGPNYPPIGGGLALSTNNSVVVAGTFRGTTNFLSSTTGVCSSANLFVLNISQQPAP